MEEQQQPETLMVRLSRPDSGMSWGFRLQGGVDFNTQLSVQVVQPKSVAARCGLQPGDGIIRINNTMTDGLTHEQAKMEIIRSCNDIDMLVMRGAVQIWKPKVTPMAELRPETKSVLTATGDEMYLQQKTSLARDHTDESSNIGSSYNRSAKPFSGFGGGAPQQQQQRQQQQQQPQQQQQQQQPPQQFGQQYGGGGQQYGDSPPQSPKRAVPNVVHAQFNSPIGIYSAGNIAHTYAEQTAGIQKQMENLDVESEPVGMKMTGTYQRLDSDPASQFYASQNESPANPNAVAGDDDHASGSPTSLQNNIPSESSERLQSENGVLSDEHAPSAETNPVINTSQPSGFKSVSAPVAKPPGTSAPKQENMHCTGCGNLVTGVFVRIKGMPYHEKCFKCVRCGIFLKQKGYFMIEGQLYCEAHARQTAEAPGDNMRYAGAVYR